jgi:hypothetical protein
MRPLTSLAGLVLLSSIARPAAVPAQSASRPWRVGVTAIAPTTLLDAGDGTVTTTPTLAVEGARRWPLRPDLTSVVRLRVARTSTEATRGPNRWAPGALTTIDATLGLEAAITPRVALDAAAGAGLWRGPADGAPFPALNGLRPQLEGALRFALTPRLSVHAGLVVTPVTADATRAQSSGTVLRPMLGVNRAF